MTPHSANPHEGPAQPVILPRLAATQPSAPEREATSEAPAPQVVSTTGWSPTAWRLGQR
jgi:hypothetical protein